MGRKIKIGDYVHGGIYAGDHNGHHVICSLKEYECPCTLDWHQAVEYCKALGMALPTKEELNLLYELSKLAPDQFRTDKWTWYWSSSEDCSTEAWSQYLVYGYQYYYDKSGSSYARPIKRIKISEYRALT